MDQIFGTAILLELVSIIPVPSRRARAICCSVNCEYRFPFSKISPNIGRVETDKDKSRWKSRDTQQNDRYRSERLIEDIKQSNRLAQQELRFDAVVRRRELQQKQQQSASIGSNQKALNSQMDQNRVDRKSLPSNTGLVNPPFQNQDLGIEC